MIASSERTRVRWVSALMASLFVLVAAKGGVLAMSPAPAAGGVSSAFAETPTRADIVDRRGELLATSVTVYSLFADPRAIWDPADVAAQLAGVFEGLDAGALAARLENRDRAFVWVRRGLTPRQRQAVFDLGLEGLGFREERRRAYPRGTLAGHVLGYTDIDGNGLAGIERSVDAHLKSSDAPLALSLDSGLQFALEAELSDAAARHSVAGAAGVLIHGRTGDVLALASWPPINPNRAGQMPRDAAGRLDRATRAVFELGSVYKPLTVAMALEGGVVAPEDIFDVAEPLAIGGFEITDDHAVPGGRASLTQILAESSNVGTVKIALDAGGERLSGFYRALGLLERAPIDLPASAAPLLPERWNEVTVATTSYGHGLAVTPLSFAAAFAVFANGGEWVAPGLLQHGAENRPRRRVLSPQTAARVTAMMREAVLDGTGLRADVPGYRIAGKTGTAEKPIAGGYSDTDNVSSFAAVFPAERPEYALLIVLDTPQAFDQEEADGVMTGTSAAFTAAPTAGRVIGRIAPLLGLAPEGVEASPPADSVSETGSAL
ncbi:MAG: penicillin-binding protein 2 [Pseudomonadota bacterium]